jgi:RNA polymerase sigma factor (sigma-70 family)
MGSNLEHHVSQAKNGNKRALETVVRRIQDKIYGLSLRMLGKPEDAEDETQEILIKIITHLSAFREESAFSSWVYRIACNHLLTTISRKSHRMGMTFGLLEELVSAEIENRPHLSISGPEKAVLLEEARLDCMQGVLACLEKDIRIAFILGELYGVTSTEGAFILDITPEAFRKRISRGRKRMQEFMTKHCGLVNNNETCHCHINVARRVEQGLKIPEKKSIINKEVAAKNRAELVSHLKELSEIDRTVAMFRRYPEYQPPDSFKNIMKGLIDSGKYRFIAAKMIVAAAAFEVTDIRKLVDWQK